MLKLVDQAEYTHFVQHDDFSVEKQIGSEDSENYSALRFSKMSKHTIIMTF